VFTQRRAPYAATVRRLSRILTLPVAAALLVASPAVASGPLSAEQTDAVRAYVRDTLDKLGVPGAAVVIVGPEGIEFAEGFGKARDDGTPVTPQTPFEVASLSKQLTSIAVMQLVVAGDLSLNATVRSYIDWFGTDGSATAKVTVRDLLAQSSGFSGNQGLTNRIDDYDGDDALERNVRRLASEGPEHTTGSFEYSNANYDVLGYLIAVVSGDSYEAYMTEHVLGPLQMTHTHLTDADARADGVAQGHYLFFALPIGYDIPFVRGSVPSSFIAASAEDLGHVLIAHLNQGAYEGTEVLDAASMADLRRPLIHPDPWDGYGWGWWNYPMWEAGELKDGADISSYSVPVKLEHGGSHATFASSMLLLPEEEIGVVVLLNLNDEIASSRFYQMQNGIAQILRGHDPPPLTWYDDALAQYGRLIGLAWVGLLVAFVAWSVRRHLRWRREPDSGPRGPWAIGWRMVVPLVIVVAQFVAFWLLVLSRGGSVTDIPRVARLSPDIGLIVIVVSLVSLAWIVIGMIWSVSLVRQRRMMSPVRDSPGAP
jgi:CubicO group peptidase (beta-lactamase class C family)